MAQLALGLAGAAVGFAVGGPTGAQIGFAVGTAAGGALFPPKLPDGPRLNDRQVQSSAYGETIPRLYGSYVVAGNIIWSTDLIERASTERVGGSKGAKYTSFSYSCSFAVSLCQGPIAGIRRIWADGKIIVDNRSPEDVPEAEIVRQSFEGTWTLHAGTETQEADPTIVAIEGDAPAYRGEAYVVFNDMQLGQFGNRIPLLRFEVVAVGTSADAQPTTIFDYNESIGSTPRLFGDLQQVDSETDLRFCGSTLTFTGQQHFAFDPHSKEIKHVFPRPTIGLGQDFPAGYQIRIGLSGVIVPDRREYWIMYRTNSASNTDFQIWWYIYDMDTFTFKTRFSRNTSSSFSVNFSFWRMHYNPLNKHVVVVLSGGFSNGLWIINSNGRFFETDVITTVNNINYDSNIFGGLLWISSYFGNFVQRIAIYNALTYSPVRVYDMWDYFPLTAGANFWSSYGDSNLAYDTRRNRWLAIGDNVGTSLRFHFYVVFNGDNGAIEETGQLDFGESFANPCVAYSAITDEYFVWSPGSMEYALFNASTLQVRKVVQTTVTLRNAVESTLYAGVYYTMQPRVDSGPVGFVARRLSIGNVVTAETVPLKDVVAAECTQVGLASAQIDLTNLQGNVRGFLVTGQGSGRGAIEALMNAYQFDAVESSGKIKFVSRGLAARTTINIDDLGSHDVGQNAPTPLPFARADETLLPQRITIRYSDKDNEFQQGAQDAQRYTTRSLNQIIVEVPVVMNAGEAKALANAALYSAWIARMSTKFTTNRKYSAIEPTDIVTIDGNDIRIGRKMLKGNMLEFEGSLENGNVYAQTPIGGTSLVTDQSVQAISRSNAAFLDIPIVRDVDDDSSFYIAHNGFQSGWPGAVIFKSTDGESFFELLTVTGKSVIGAATTVLAPYTDNTFDELNIVNIALTNLSDELESRSALQVLNGANACLIGDEILQFKNAVLQNNGSYNLSGLLRGRRSTPTDNHASGDRFVLLTTGTISRPIPEDSEIGLARNYKVTTFGTSELTTPTREFTNFGIGRRPFPPVFLRGGRTAAGNLVIAWIRCSRVGSAWLDNVDAPIGETTEAYEIEIVNTGTSPPTVVRTIAVTSPTHTYTLAQQETDFGSPVPSSITVRVYQMSSTFGRGLPAQATL
jgi:hypothetical protein